LSATGSRNAPKVVAISNCRSNDTGLAGSLWRGQNWTVVNC
jgi:hypothetical protein